MRSGQRARHGRQASWSAMVPVVVTLLGGAASAGAAVRTFNPGAAGDILDPNNYSASGSGAPVNGDSLTVGAGGNATLTYNASLASLATLALNNVASASPTLDVFSQAGGTLSIAALQLSNPSSTAANLANGLYQITGGSATVTTLLQFGAGNGSGINVSSGGTFNYTGTASALAGNVSTAVVTINVAGAGSSLNLYNASNAAATAANFALGYTAGSTANMSVTDGAVYNGYSNAFYVGLQQSSASLVVSNAAANFNDATGSFTIGRLGATGVVTVNGTGSIRVASPQIQLGNGTPGGTTIAATGTLTLNDSATFTATTANTTMFLGASNGGTGIINVNGNATLTVRLIGYGGVAVNSNGVGVVNLNGGTITTANVYRNSLSTTAASATTQLFNANGGTLVANASTGTFFDRLNVALLPGGLTFNTGSNVIGVTPAFMNGSGGLTKVGAGTLAVGVSTGYAGNTLVGQGTLLANASAGSATGTGTVTVASGATLAGGTKAAAGLVGGSVNVSSGATIGAGNATAVGNLSTGSMRWATGGTFAVKVAAGTVGPADSTLGDTLIVNGLTVDASAGGAFSVTLTSLGATAFDPATSQLVIARDVSPTAVAGEFRALIDSGQLVLTTTSGITAPGTLALAELDDGTVPQLVVIAAAPEPTTLALLGLVTPMLAMRRRRRRHAVPIALSVTH